MSEGIEIRVTQKGEAVLRDLNTLQRRAVRPAINLTLSSLIRMIRTRTVRGISSETQIQQKYFRRRVRGYNYGVRELNAKAWIGLAKPIGVSKIAGMTAEKAERWKEFSPRVFKTKAKSGKKIFIQRVGRSRYPVTEPKVNLDKIGPKILNRVARRVVRQRFYPELQRHLENRLKRQNVFDLSTLRDIVQVFGD